MMRDVDILEVGLDFGNGVTSAGRLTMNDDNVGVFEYDPAFVASALRVSPHFPTNELVIAANPSAYDRVHGVFADSLPDAWGRFIIRHRLADEGIAYDALTALQKLALVGTRGMGALVYKPETDDAAFVPDEPDVDMLARESLKILAGDSSRESVIQLERLGGSSGGTRPKVLVFVDERGHVRSHRHDGYEPWIIKFRYADDFLDAGPLEVAYADMARSAGIAMSETLLIPSADGPGHFATKRFDRGPNGQRFHVISAAGVLDQDWQSPTTYSQLLKITRYVTQRHADVERIFRRMVFNVLSNNRDDHMRQHAFIMDERGSWSLAPAFDLTYSYGPNGQHYLDVNGKPRNITVDDMRALAKEHAIKKADDTINEVAAAVDRFNEFAVTHGVTDGTRQLVGTQISARLRESAAPSSNFRP